MKKNIALALFVIAIIFSFAGCNKFKEYWYPHGHNPQKDFDLCRITEIQQSAGPLVPNRTGTFYYNSNGNLDSVVFDDGGIVHYWKYDEHKVLVEYREAFNHDITDFRNLHKYASENGRVIRDTTWVEGASGYIIQVWTLEYDDKGRVVRETGYRIDEEDPGSVLPERVYTYNAQGNLSGGEFDDEINFLRTNSVLQFIHRDYSMNNPKQLVLGYNEYHLPIRFRTLHTGSFLGGSIPFVLSYSCEPIPFGYRKEQCRFDSVTQTSNNNSTVDATFYYTPGGRPLSVQYVARSSGYELNTHTFEYNNNNQLISYKIWNGMDPYIRHNYGYAGKRIGVDTLSSEPVVQISQLYYDNQGRIIKEDIHVIERDLMPVSEFSSKEYVYDGAGNLVSPLVTSYDDKVNYLRVHPLWMFIHRNYSRNNPQGVTQYNNRNLPLGFSTRVFGFLDYGEPAEIEYACDVFDITPDK